MKRITIFISLLLGLSCCEDEKIRGDKRLLIKEIVDVMDNSELSFTYNADTTLSRVVKTTINTISTWNFKYEMDRLSKISRTIENIENIPPQLMIVESNDTITLNYGSNGMIASFFIRSVDTDELVEKVVYQYALDNSIEKIEYSNYRIGFSETRELEFTNHNLSRSNDTHFQYDNGKNPINQIGLSYKDFYWGDFEYGTYFSKNNVIGTGDWEFVISYNEFKYPTRIKAVSDKRVWSEKIFTYY